MTYDIPYEFDEAACDRWHDGARDAHRSIHRTSDDADYLEGYEQALEDMKVVVVYPSRPEGYYHSAIGSFE